MFRVSIRDMLWLTLAAALAICWFLDHRRADKLQKDYSRDVNHALDVAIRAEHDFAERLKYQTQNR